MKRSARSTRRGRNKRWIQRAIKHPGALREYFARKGAHVFQSNGKLSREKVEEYYERHRNHLDPTTKRRINIYLTQLSRHHR